MPVPIRRAPWLAAAAVLVLAADVCAAEPARAADVSAPSVRYHDGRLSARIQGLPLDDVLRAVSAETGLRFDGIPLDERDVFKRFDDVPLAEALRRLIGRQNFTLVYGAGGQPERVRLLGVPALPVPRGSKAPPPASFQVVLARQPPVAISDRLAAALGAVHGPLPLIRVLQGLRLDDATIRGEAVGTFLRSLQATPALLTSFLALDDLTVATLARSWGGAHAADALSLLAARASDPGVRGLATKGLARLRSDQPSRG
jgi:hypothetical protein